MTEKDILLIGFLIAVFASSSVVLAQNAKVICATARDATECENLQRGDSEVTCQFVQDSIECAQRIRNNTADFGVFSSESLLHLASLRFDSLSVLRELRNRDRRLKSYDFESVVVARKTLSGGLTRLRGAKFCHPGLFYGKSQKWSERFLKHFERQVTNPQCAAVQSNSPAEIEAATLSEFFGMSCRPGVWSMDKTEDTLLKQRYPNLCSLCSGQGCQYPTDILEPHQQALNCLTTGGDVAYVSAEDAASFLSTNNANNDFEYMCPNGTLQALPCPWLQQPWRAIVANTNLVPNIANQIDSWINNQGQYWTEAIRNILQSDNHILITTTPIQSVREYVGYKRAIPEVVEFCNTQSTWCTTSIQEQEKCEIISHAGLTSGVLPNIQCKQDVGSDIECFKEIQNKNADFTGIDSNLGYLARRLYNLTSLLYAETENAKYSSVVVVVRANSKYERFENLKGAKACFPEYGGITSLALINIGKGRGFMANDECSFSKLLSEFFLQSCAPGADDNFHKTIANLPENLCSLCKATASGRYFVEENADIIEDEVTEASIDDAAANYDEVVDPETQSDNGTIDITPRAGLTASCQANDQNRYFGTRGALQCLYETGDVAVVELQNLEAHAKALNIPSSNFRIMCRNGTLADSTGFAIDSNCPLVTIVDGEIIARRNDPKNQGIRNALLSLDRYLQNDPDFKMYNIFTSKRDVLFQDSTLGLTRGNEENVSPSVQSYINLFKPVEECVQGTTGSSGAVMSLNIVLVVSAIMGLLYNL